MKGVQGVLKPLELRPRLLAILRRDRFKLTACGILLLVALMWHYSAYATGRGGRQSEGVSILRGRGDPGILGSLRIRSASWYVCRSKQFVDPMHQQLAKFL